MDTKKYKIILTDIAKNEFEEIYEYIANSLLEMQIAKKLMDKIEQEILRLEQNPYLAPKVCVKPHKEILRRLVVDNYVILYDVVEEKKQVVVYRVIYGKMDYLDIEENF